jgi:prenyl protein peptidase
VAALLVLYALAYFMPFYASPKTRPSAKLSRDAPSVIKNRILSVTLACLACCTATYFILLEDSRATGQDVLHLMGLWPVGLAVSFKALLLTMLLFLGPLFAYFVVDEGWRDWLNGIPLREVQREWTVWRNLVAVCL